MNNQEPTEEDFLNALKEMEVYIDITASDLKKIYSLAIKHAKKRLLSPKAEDIMTKKVISVNTETDLKTATKMLSEAHISGMPVLDENNKLVGIITETDIISALTGKKRANFFDFLHKKTEKHPSKVKQVMTTPVITIEKDTPVYKIAKLFKDKNINRVPVVDENQNLVGIITRADIVKIYGDMDKW